MSRLFLQKALLYNGLQEANPFPGLLQVEFIRLIRKNIISCAHPMNKAAIVDAVAEKLGGTKADAERAVDVMIDSIVDSLKKGGEVSIAGLGIFSAKMRAARTARNPRTGETVDVPAQRVPKFRAAKALKDAVK
jgi:DNA-binding protein HU-beta